MLNLIQSKDELINKIEQLMVDTRGNVVTTINYTLLVTYMEIGKILVEFYRNASFDTNKSITEISKILTKKLGKGFQELIFGI